MRTKNGSRSRMNENAIRCTAFAILASRFASDVYIINAYYYLYTSLAKKKNKNDGLFHSALNFLFFFLVIASNKSSYTILFPHFPLLVSLMYLKVRFLVPYCTIF